MRSLLTLLLAAVITTGSGYIVRANSATAYIKKIRNTEDRNVSGFSGVAVAGSFDVYIKQGAAEAVKVDAPSDKIGKVITEVKNGVLKIYVKEGSGWNWGDDKIKVYVTAKEVKSITLSGSGDVVFDGGIKASTLSLAVSGSGDLSGKVYVTNLESKVSGSGDIKVSGTATSSDVRVTGSGDFDGSDLVSTNTAVRVVGSGDATVNASENVDASVVGSGDVHFNKKAKHVTQSKVGSGDINSY